MNNSEYWENRIAENTWGTYNSLEEKNRALLEMYQEASLSISDELYRVTEKINAGKGVTLSDMHKMNRLSNMQKNFENTIRSLGENVESFGKENMMEGFKDTYSNVMTELGQVDFALPNQKLMEEMMNRPWQGSTFSERLWKNTQVLASNLNYILTSGLTQGKTVTEMAIQLNNRMNEGFNVSHRLVRTETMHYLNESAFKAYEDGGCEEVQIWAAIDERTCPTCGAKHGNVYKLKDRPALPLHANCRCTYLPVINLDKKSESNNNKALNKEGNEIKFELGNMKESSTEEVRTVITDLSNQYNTRLIGVTNEKAKKGLKGSVGMDFKMNLSTTQKDTVVHEFAHSLSMTRADKLGLTNDKEFWKEIKTLRTQYNKAIAKDSGKKISSYSLDSADEFMAEAFTQSYLKNTESLGWEYGTDYEYADKVKAIVDKYFKKSISNNGNSDIIKIENQNFKINKSVGAMAKRFYVKEPKSLKNTNLYIKEGTEVTGIKVIASGDKIREVGRLINDYALPNGQVTKPSDWYKVRGRAVITDGINEELREIHWYQADNIGKVEFKFPSNKKQR